MAKITDPNYLEQGIEVTFDADEKVISLHDINEHQDSNIDDMGVTLRALYSFCKEEWRTDGELIKSDFPVMAYTHSQFETINGWNIGEDSYRHLRDGSMVDGDNTYSNMITIGSIDGGLYSGLVYETYLHIPGDFIQKRVKKHRL